MPDFVDRNQPINATGACRLRIYEGIDEWRTLSAVRIGDQSRSGSPDAVVVLDENGVPAGRFDIYRHAGDYWFAVAAIIWAGWYVFGFGGRVVLVSCEDGWTREIDLHAYFGGFHAMDDCLIGISGEALVRIDRNGDLVWRSDPVGLDGVVIRAVENGVILGEGEWDPPGGWRAFRLSLDSGKAC